MCYIFALHWKYLHDDVVLLMLLIISAQILLDYEKLKYVKKKKENKKGRERKIMEKGVGKGAALMHFMKISLLVLLFIAAHCS